MNFFALANNGGEAHLGGEHNTVRELSFISSEQNVVQATHARLVNGSTEAEGEPMSKLG
jgi:hypothetical protein